ncbi:MAG TPA: hypothetical protein VMS22_15995 [Candidatus Eisenbacteria bacterium]|nr:hypothetical protein [Candidatus Eisenbacteria bacterium]
MGRLLPCAIVLTLALRPTPTRADDGCLAGASTLADQRAMATLRASLETSCPCAAAKSRGTFRRCGKGVLAAAVGDATLRSACEKTAKRVIKTASCGTQQVPCGRVQPAAGVVASCKVRRAAACTDRARFDQTACSDATYCADVVDWSAGTCSDVRVPGPYGVGVRVITFTKQSAVNPNDPRPLDVVVWYPTTPGAGPIDGRYDGVLDAPVDGSGAPYPVVMFSHGSCGFPTQSLFLWPLVASRGYVVIAPPHPGNTLFEFPTCSTPQAQLASAVERPQDVRFTLDQMLAENANPGSAFFGVLDPTRIGMSGHSFGGFTTYLAATQDTRYRVAIPMAAAVPPSHPVLTIPSLTMISTADSVVNNNATRSQYDLAATPKYFVEIANTGHFAYSDGCFPSPDCNPPVTLTQDEAHLAVLRWVIPFLEWYLKGDDRFAAFFETPQPVGVTVQIN